MEEKLPTVAVLMSTYNGDRFISEQIESILGQKSVFITLFIRDDGSTDKTLQIIDQYSNNNSNIIVKKGKNIGLAKSFMWLLYNAPVADYYAFADQDDVWVNNKLIEAINVIRKIDCANVREGFPLFAEDFNSSEKLNNKKNGPVLYASNQMLVDSQLNYIGLHYQTIPPCNLYESITKNYMYGCTMVMNRPLQQKLGKVEKFSKKILIKKNHDAITLYCAYIFGCFVYDDRSFILYRQHGDNAVGGLSLSLTEKIKDKWVRLTKHPYKNLRSETCIELLNTFEDNMSETIKNNLKTIAEANSFQGILRLINNKTVFRSFHENVCAVFLRGIFRWI